MTCADDLLSGEVELAPIVLAVSAAATALSTWLLARLAQRSGWVDVHAMWLIQLRLKGRTAQPEVPRFSGARHADERVLGR